LTAKYLLKDPNLNFPLVHKLALLNQRTLRRLSECPLIFLFGSILVHLQIKV